MTSEEAASQAEEEGEEQRPPEERAAEGPGVREARRGVSTAEERADVLRRLAQSGLTVAEFCRREGLSNYTVREWKEAADGGKGRKNSTSAQRAELLKRYEMSGLTVAAFCRAQGISRKKFSAWKNAIPGWATKKTGGGFSGRRSQEERDRYVRKFEQGGKTLAEFCREEGLSRTLFEGWQDSLARRTKTGHAGFAEVTVTDELTITGGLTKGVIITVDSTITVSVPPGTGCLWVGGLLRSLRGK